MPLSKSDAEVMHRRTQRWREAQKAHAMKTGGRLMTLQQIADTEGMTKQAVRHFCMHRAIPYGAHNPSWGYKPSASVAKQVDDANGFTAFLNAMKETADV